MTRVTELLLAASNGDARASDDLLPLVYDELRRLARARLAHEKPGQTLQATALVHEAYLRLTGEEDVQWNNGRHFFAAAAEAMRRILIEAARKKKAERHGGNRERIQLDSRVLAVEEDEQLIALDTALSKLEEASPRKAEVVKLRFFAGLSIREAADALGISDATADRDWAFARAWLHKEIESM